MINHQLFQATLDTLSEPLLVIDSQGRVVLLNQALQRLRGRLPAHSLQYEQPGRRQARRTAFRLERVYSQSYRALVGGLLEKDAVAGIQAVLEGTSPYFEITFACALEHEAHTLKLLVTALEPGGGAVLVFQDLTEQTRRETEIYNLANLDPLTGLLNRRLFFAEAERVLALAERHQHPFALLYLDLDGFKAVNDRSGHEAGDEVLCQVAARLRERLRGGDLVARLGGDEFLMLLPETDEREALAAAKRYAQGFRQPFFVGDVALTLTGSFGVAAYPAHARTIGELVKIADNAMYPAKANGGKTCLYVPTVGTPLADNAEGRGHDGLYTYP